MKKILLAADWNIFAFDMFTFSFRELLLTWSDSIWKWSASNFREKKKSQQLSSLVFESKLTWFQGYSIHTICYAATDSDYFARSWVKFYYHLIVLNYMKHQKKDFISWDCYKSYVGSTLGSISPTRSFKPLIF